MKSLAACFVVIALAACGSSSSSSTSGTTGGSGSTTGAHSTSTGGKTGTGTGGGATGTAAGASSTGSPLGIPCTVDATGADSCSQYNLMCSAILTGQAGSGTCVLPQNLFNCDQTTFGCQDGGAATWTDGGTSWDAGEDVDAGLDSDGGTIVDVVWVDGGTFWDAGVAGESLVCSSGFVNNNTGDQVQVCLEPCTTGADCDLTYLTCLGAAEQVTPPGCFYNFCQATQADFSACDSTTTGANDGQCLPYFDPNTQAATFTVCYQNGTAANGTPCDPNVRNGADSQCGFYDFCQANVANDGGLCYPITLDGGNCAGTDLAIEAAGTIFGSANFGICIEDCSTGQSCTVGTCQALSATLSGCLP